MKHSLLSMMVVLLTMLSACGVDNDETSPSQEPEQSQQGVLSNQQQQALEAARGVEQSLLNSAADREKELEARLRQQ